MKRSRPPLKLHKSPLVMVLAQVRISHVAKMGDYVDDVQERLRRSGFPRFEEGRGHEILLRPDFSRRSVSTHAGSSRTRSGRRASS